MDETQEQTTAEHRAWPRPASRPVPGLTFSMTWAQRLKRVFNIDIETCNECGGTVKVDAPAHPCALGISASMHVIAGIEDPVVIKKILPHLNGIIPSREVVCLPESRAPLQADLLKETHHSNDRLH